MTIGFVAGLEVTLNVRDFFFTQKQLRGSLMGDRRDLEWGLAQVQSGTIRPVLDRVLPLSEAAAAHQLLAASALRGNIFLDPWA
ncbi:MAG: zinc-binding dehydrogenase [Oscillatoriales cyanobacterium SM2_2_1]|nr:zinc-binding dehydrogenase [Oscillatoriales cyanobacterium SM2_2_1]